jgi:hypothetical protein
MRYERIPGRRGRAELSAIGKTLAEIAEIAGLPAARNSGYRTAVTNVSVSRVIILILQ